MRYERNSDVVYRSGFVIVLIAVIALVWVLGILGTAAAGHGVPVVFVVIALTVLPFQMIMALRVRVVLRSDEIVLHDFFRTESVRYKAIAGVHHAGSWFDGWTVEIRHRDGTVTELPRFLGGRPLNTSWHHGFVHDLTRRIEDAPPIRRSAGVKRLIALNGDTAGTDLCIESPTWRQIETAIRSLDGHTRSDLYLYPDLDDPESYLAVAGGDGDRYLVFARNFNALFDEAINPGAGSTMVDLVVAGRLGSFALEQLVTLDQAITAAQAFHDRGELASSITWKHQ